MITVRLATEEDWAVIRDLRLSALGKAGSVFVAGGEPESADDAGWRQYLRARLTEGNTTLIAFDGATPVGMGCGKPNPYKADAYVLHSLWVEPDARGKGVAELLNAGRADFASKQGYNYAQCCTKKTNAQACGLYRKLGYTEMPEPSEFRPAQAAHEVVFYKKLGTL